MIHFDQRVQLVGLQISLYRDASEKMYGEILGKITLRGFRPRCRATTPTDGYFNSC